MLMQSPTSVAGAQKQNPHGILATAARSFNSQETGSSQTDHWVFPSTPLIHNPITLEIAASLDAEKQVLTLHSLPNKGIHLDCHIRQENRMVIVTIDRMTIIDSLCGKGLGKQVVRKIVETYAKYLNPNFGWRITDVLFVETNLDSFRGIAFLNRIKHQSAKLATFGPCRSRIALNTLPSNFQTGKVF